MLPVFHHLHSFEHAREVDSIDIATTARTFFRSSAVRAFTGAAASGASAVIVAIEVNEIDVGGERSGLKEKKKDELLLVIRNCRSVGETTETAALADKEE